jgi:hypothetical protein
VHPPRDAYDGFEEQPVRDLSRFVTELADSESALKHIFHLRFTLFRDEGQTISTLPAPSARRAAVTTGPSSKSQCGGVIPTLCACLSGDTSGDPHSRSDAASHRCNVLGVHRRSSDQKFADLEAADRELLGFGLADLEPSDNNSPDSQRANGRAARS